MCETKSIRKGSVSKRELGTIEVFEDLTIFPNGHFHGKILEQFKQFLNTLDESPVGIWRIAIDYTRKNGSYYPTGLFLGKKDEYTT